MNKPVRPSDQQRPAALLPRADHIAYLANLLTVLAVLFGVYVVVTDSRRARRRPPTPYGPADVPLRSWVG